MVISKIFKIQCMFTYLFYISLTMLKHWGPYKIQIDADHSGFPKFSRTVIHNCGIFLFKFIAHAARLLPRLTKLCFDCAFVNVTYMHWCFQTVQHTPSYGLKFIQCRQFLKSTLICTDLDLRSRVGAGYGESRYLKGTISDSLGLRKIFKPFRNKETYLSITTWTIFSQKIA